MIPPPLIDSESLLADLDALAQIGRDPDGALNRIAYSPTDQAGRAWVAEQMRALGLRVHVDAAGNTIGRYPGSADLPPIALGSHSDTVPNGGSYDGALGVVAALACVRALHTAGVRLRHPMEIINFAAEEATMAGGTTGSQAMAGLFDPAIFAGMGAQCASTCWRPGWTQPASLPPNACRALSRPISNCTSSRAMC
jgi:N-carbamoyl-L-amino-acid hydrolase